MSDKRLLLIGAIAGATIALVILLGWVVPAFWLVIASTIGAGVVWLVHGMTSGRLHLRAAWNALRGASDSDSFSL
jgi:hypothetical protein